MMRAGLFAWRACICWIDCGAGSLWFINI